MDTANHVRIHVGVNILEILGRRCGRRGRKSLNLVLQILEHLIDLGFYLVADLVNVLVVKCLFQELDQVVDTGFRLTEDKHLALFCGQVLDEV